MAFLAQCSPQGAFDLCVPQAVDQWVQHRVEKTVKQEKDLLLLLRMAGLGGHVRDDGTAKEEPDHAEVGRAGGEGLPAAVPRLDPQDGNEDARVGHQHQAERPLYYKRTSYKYDDLVEPCVSTGQFKDRQEFTEKMVDFMRPTEGQPQNKNHLSKSQEGATCPGCHHQGDADTPAHDDRISERVADGHIPIIGHHQQEKTFC
uniref:Uncharacterized protein n=1 Tax=Rousettus aegyptiacus TaxID=9407 RepID=A0A7J8D713_ROUAE|nr:hypothetical protein HJG63_008855 [Rousettus aegyptiacus]